MTNATTTEFLAALARFRLVEPGQFAELSASLAKQPLEPCALARTLIDRGWLTPYQANQFFLGRTADLLLGSYVLLERLGEGGMGAVFKARNWKLGRTVALKLIRKDRVASLDAVRRFQREIRAVGQLNHPNIVRALDADEVGGTYFFVMEHVEGTDLMKLVQQQGRLPIATACEYVRQAALGLQHAHERGTVHRDVKPGNLLVQRPQAGASPVVKVLDLGLARLQCCPEDDGSSTLTETGAVMGTPDFLAPEQARQSHNVDIRADLYSLGCTLYFLLAGRVPFPGGGLSEKLIWHQLDEPEPVERLRPEVPPSIAAVVRKLMAKKPEDRYQTPAELAEVLAKGGEPGATAVSADNTARLWGNLSQPGDPYLATTVPPREPSPRRAPRRLLAGAAALLAGLGLIGWLLFRAGPTKPSVGVTPVSCRVEANRPWQDSGVDVVEGETVTLVPEGIWRSRHQVCPAAGLPGASQQRKVLPKAAFFCLLVRVGDDPSPLAVPGPQSFKPKRGGRLFFQANDLDLENDSGSLQVTIEGGRRSEERAPPPGLTSLQALDSHLKPLFAKTQALGASPEQVRETVFDFCRLHAGTPQWARAAELLEKVPLVNSIGMKLVPIPPGKFLMGSPTNEPGRNKDEKQHEVVLTQPFFIGAYKVRRDQFRMFVQETKYQTEAETSGKGSIRAFPDAFRWSETSSWEFPIGRPHKHPDDHPVNCVTWNDAQKFCDWLSKKEGKRYALPTEAQWEHCYRAGTQARFCFGDDDNELKKYAWYRTNCATEGWNTHPVGKKWPNAWGLFDVHGNVWEWTADWYAADSYSKSPKEDPTGPRTGKYRVARGGAWPEEAQHCRAARRDGWRAPDVPDQRVGFRVVLLSTASRNPKER